MVLALTKGPEHPKKLVLFFWNLKKNKKKTHPIFPPIFFLHYYYENWRKMQSGKNGRENAMRAWNGKQTCLFYFGLTSNKPSSGKKTKKTHSTSIFCHKFLRQTYFIYGLIEGKYKIKHHIMGPYAQKS